MFICLIFLKSSIKPFKAFVLKINGDKHDKISSERFFFRRAVWLLIPRKSNGLVIKPKYTSQGYLNNK